MHSTTYVQQGQCFFDDSKSSAGISGMVRIKSGSESDLLVAVATVGPIAVNVDASSSMFRVCNKLMQKACMLCIHVQCWGRLWAGGLGDTSQFGNLAV